MEDIHAANHRWLSHERKIVDSPGGAADLGVHLDEDFGHNGAQVLALLDGADKNDLRGHGELFEEITFDIVIKGALAFLAGQEENHHLDAFVKLLFQLLDPVVRPGSRLYLAHLRLTLVVTAGLKALSHSGLELIANLSVAVTVEDGPFAQWHLREHLALNLAIDVTGRRFNVE